MGTKDPDETVDGESSSERPVAQERTLGEADIRTVSIVASGDRAGRPGSGAPSRSAVPSSNEAPSRFGPRSDVGLPARYQDLGVLAGGAFGEVRRVRDLALDRVVAMKLLHVQHSDKDLLRRRFLVEAQVTAQLQHPGIVALYDRGELADGRLWYTMKEVRGRTLQDVLEELHAHATPDGFRETPSGWTFRRVIDAFARIAQAMAYAHSRGVVHRDLKPANLMVGEFGEVLVMDWGLARKAGAVDSARRSPATTTDEDSISELTRGGDILGTPAFMPPEQARGDSRTHGPASDVYALGAVLYVVLTGHLPYTGSALEVLRALFEGRPPAPVREAALGGPPVPEELCAIVERAMRHAIEDRYESAEALARDVVAWLDGVRRREQALAALSKASAAEPEIEALRARAAEAEADARSLQSGVRPNDPIEKKRPAWERQDEAARLGREAALAETQWMEAIHGALSVDPDLLEAHAMLADHHRGRLIDAERAHREEDAARAEAMLRIHDRGQHAAFLRGDGALTLVTDPPGAEVIVERCSLADRRLVAVQESVIGPTPLVKVPLQRGSYLLRIRAPGRAEVRYPVLIERDEHWDGCAPGDSEPHPIALPLERDLGPDDCYVPAGWCWTGGDTEATDSLPRRRVWMDAFVMRRFPVTHGELLGMLQEMHAARMMDAELGFPPGKPGLRELVDAVPSMTRDASGGLVLRPVDPSRPASLSWYLAVACARFLARRTGLPFRLPDELEREKAARGADGRFFAWGHHAEPGFACTAESQGSEPEPVTGHPEDESPYGIRGLSGNMRDWCANLWRHEGPAIEEGRLRLTMGSPDDDDFRAVKGGAWGSAVVHSRAAGRFASRPGVTKLSVGFRLVRSFTRR